MVPNAYRFSRSTKLGIPVFAFEAKSGLGSSNGAVNQLSGSLSHALGMLRQLRQDAAIAEDLEPLRVFGAVSVADLWSIYVAYEENANETEMRCVSFPKTGEGIA